jgi:hypothetical protein
MFVMEEEEVVVVVEVAVEAAVIARPSDREGFLSAFPCQRLD